MITRNEITLIHNLNDRGTRQQVGLFVAEGRKLVAEIAASDFRIRTIYTTEEITRRYPGVEYEYASPKQMERMSHLRTPTDILALVEIPRRRTDPDAFGRELTLALDGVQDPGNLGTVIRLADWFGVRDILCSRDTADCFNPKVVQATMGAITRVHVHYGELEEWLAAAAAAGKSAKAVPVYGMFLDGENIHAATLTPASGIIVMGSEGRGISPEIEKRVSRRLHIPRFPPDAPTAESLNVATATAITLAEFRRRR